MNARTTLFSPRALENSFGATTATYYDYNESVGLRNIQIAVRGTSIPLGHGVNVTILNPAQPLEFDDANDNSIVLRLQVYNVTFLLTGDSEAFSEASILSAGYDQSCTILKVGHHGSRTSTSSEYLEVINPEIAVISVGEGNRYDHPNQETLDKLTLMDAIVYRTDFHGTVTITTDGMDYHVKIEKVYPIQPPTPEPEPTSEPMPEPELEPELEPEQEPTTESTPETTPEPKSEIESKFPIPGFNPYHTAAGIITAIAVISLISKKT